MGVTEEGISMSDESKKKAGLPDKKVMGLFVLGMQTPVGALQRDRGVILKPYKHC